VIEITTWNVNGIRAALKNGIDKWIIQNQPDILCFQEIKARIDQFDLSEFTKMGYESVWNSADQPGYSGVGTLFKIKPESISYGLSNPKFDNEGRVIQTSYPDFELFNIYFPNGGRGYERVQYKLDFYKELLDITDHLHQQGKQIIVTGDFNTAHREIDLKNPKENSKYSGFLPEERIWIDYYLQHGFVDVYRVLYPERIQYSWWTYRFHAREKGIGWRLDYFLISKELLSLIKDVTIHDSVQGSDHCPVTLELDIE
jgi:exodeoxyribonuclease-3